MTTTLRIEPDLLGSLDAEIRSGNLESAMNQIYEVFKWTAHQFPMRYNHVPEFDELVQTIGRELADGIGVADGGETPPGGVNVFIATELYNTGGHTRVIADMTRNTRGPNLVILTDLFGRYARQELRLGVIAEWMDASILLLPDMSMFDKTRNLLRLLRALPVNAIGIIAHHEDVVAYAACNDRVPAPQIYVHHADYTPTLGATVKHYRHIDLALGDQRMCKAAGYYEDPLYMPMAVPRNFQPVPAGAGFNTATGGRFAKFAAEGPLCYADMVVAVLDTIVGSHVHFGGMPPEYLQLIRDRIAASGHDPARFVYLGQVESVQQALIAHQVGVYFTSAPVGGGRTYIEVLGLGVAILVYEDEESEASDLPIAAFHVGSTYDPMHRRWSDITELRAHLQSLDLNEEFAHSQRAFLSMFPDGESARVTQLFF